MKTKTTLVTLLFAFAIMTPSYGMNEVLLQGAKEKLRELRGQKIEVHYAMGAFEGFISGVWWSGKVFTPAGVTVAQVSEVVAKYIEAHPEQQHLHEGKLIQRAFKEAWPIENVDVEY